MARAKQWKGKTIEDISKDHDFFRDKYVRECEELDAMNNSNRTQLEEERAELGRMRARVEEERIELATERASPPIVPVSSMCL